MPFHLLSQPDIIYLKNKSKKIRALKENCPLKTDAACVYIYIYICIYICIRKTKKTVTLGL